MDKQVEPGERHPTTMPLDGIRPELLAAEPGGSGETHQRQPGHAVSAGTESPVPTGPSVPTGPPVPTGSAERPLTPGEALMTLFLDNADNGRNAANDELVAALRLRAREIRAIQEIEGFTDDDR